MCVISYLFFGVCTIISILSHITLCADAEDGDVDSTAAAWAAAVLFAHITTSLVFESRSFEKSLMMGACDLYMQAADGGARSAVMHICV